MGPGPNVLFGFSNGAYFATLVATRALGAFDAIAIAHGGPVPPTRANGKKPPLLLLTADDDPSDGEMRQLDAELAREKWPHELVSREGGHALPDADIAFALSFFDRALREPLPLRPPLQQPRPRKDAAPPDAEPIPSTDAGVPLEESPYDEPADDGGGSP
jgi:dienelactone hydrolase